MCDLKKTNKNSSRENLGNYVKYLPTEVKLTINVPLVNVSYCKTLPIVLLNPCFLSLWSECCFKVFCTLLMWFCSKLDHGQEISESALTIHSVIMEVKPLFMSPTQKHIRGLLISYQRHTVTSM